MRSDNWAVRIRKVIMPIFIYLLITFEVSFVGSFFVALYIQMTGGYVNYEEYYEASEELLLSWSLPMTAVAALITLPILVHMYNKDKQRLIIKQPDVSPVGYVAVAVLGMCACFLLNALIVVSGLYELLSSGYADTATSIYTSPVWMQYLITAVLVPIVEELVFRGLVFRRMRTYLIPSLAVVISAILFGIYHMNLLQFIYATCLGLLLAYVYEEFRTLIAPIVLHASANAISIFISDNTSVAELLSGTDTRYIVSMVVSLVGTVLCAFLVYRFAHPKKGDNIHEGDN